LVVSKGEPIGFYFAPLKLGKEVDVSCLGTYELVSWIAICK
jgi:hypothetical protein